MKYKKAIVIEYIYQDQPSAIAALIRDDGAVIWKDIRQVGKVLAH